MWNRLLLLKAQLLGHEGIRRYGANTAWLMGEKVLRMFMGLFVGIWVARYLGPEQFGLLSYAQSFVFLFTAIATLGLDSIVVRELVKDSSQRNVLLGTAFALKLIGSICILPLLWFGVQFTSNDSYTNLLIFIIASGTIFQSFNVIDFYYQSSVLSKYVAFANTVSLAISSIIKIVLIFNQASLLAFAIVGVFDTVILSLGLIYFYWQKTQHSLREWRFDRVVAKRLLKDSWPLIISSVMISLYMKVDQVMIKEMLDNNAVGQYAAAVRISEAWYFIPMAICNSVFPAIINAKKVSEALYYQRLQRLYLLMISLAIVVALPVSLVSNKIIYVLYGSEYFLSGQILIIHIWAGIFVGIGVASSKWMISEGLQAYSMINTMIGTFMNVILNYILITRIGVLGAALSTVITYAFASYLLQFFFKVTRKNFYVVIQSIMRLKNGI
ncbi:flippase [Psychrobacter immobilis]|uniref:flippase n=1 Tax=Psychrobacter immobilis TaxID=498 RepID=UPI001D11AA61|nr:flippase [Psychrobacter immobilis]